MENNTSVFFARERENPLLLGEELAILLITLVAIPYWCVLPIAGTPDAATYLVQKIIPCLLLLNFAVSSVWDAREGMVVPWFFTINLVFFTISCIAQASQITGVSVFLGTIVENVWIGRLLVLSLPLIGLLVCALCCWIVGFVEEKTGRDQCGAGDIKCIVSLFFLPMQPDRICQAVIVGLLLLLAVSLWIRWKNGVSIPVRGLPWLYAGTVPALFYFY